MTKPVGCTCWDMRLLRCRAVGVGAIGRYLSASSRSTATAQQMAPTHEGASVAHLSPDLCRRMSDLEKNGQEKRIIAVASGAKSSALEGQQS